MLSGCSAASVTCVWRSCCEFTLRSDHFSSQIPIITLITACSTYTVNDGSPLNTPSVRDDSLLSSLSLFRCQFSVVSSSSHPSFSIISSCPIPSFLSVVSSSHSSYAFIFDLISFLSVCHFSCLSFVHSIFSRCCLFFISSLISFNFYTIS